jgi:hypothetical protein
MAKKATLVVEAESASALRRAIDAARAVKGVQVVVAEGPKAGPLAGPLAGPETVPENIRVSGVSHSKNGRDTTGNHAVNVFLSNDAVQGTSRAIDTSINHTVRRVRSREPDVGWSGTLKVLYMSRFDEFWALYPKREGGNPKRAAMRAWNARIRQGIKPAEMVAGVARYANYVRAVDNEFTRYVLHAATFLGPDEHWAQPWAVPTNGRRNGNRITAPQNYGAASTDDDEVRARR